MSFSESAEEMPVILLPCLPNEEIRKDIWSTAVSNFYCAFPTPECPVFKK